MLCALFFFLEQLTHITETMRQVRMTLSRKNVIYSELNMHLKK